MLGQLIVDVCERGMKFMPQVLKHADGNRGCSSLCPVHDSLHSVSDDSLDACSKDVCTAIRQNRRTVRLVHACTSAQPGALIPTPNCFARGEIEVMLHASLIRAAKVMAHYLVALVIAGLAVNEHRTGASSCRRGSICVLLIPFFRGLRERCGALVAVVFDKKGSFS